VENRKLLEILNDAPHL